MRDTKQMKEIMILLVIVIVLASNVGWLYKVYKDNGEFVEKTINNTFGNEYTREEIISDLEKALSFKFIKSEDKIELYAKLSKMYFLEQNYSKMTEAAVNSIYLADKKGEYYYCAWNYINLSEAFMMLYDYETAESLMGKALTYNIQDAEKERVIKEKAYIYMAELQVNMGKIEEARECLRLSMNYLTKSASDYEESILKRKIIWARTFWNEGNYGRAKEILKDIPCIEENDELIVKNVKIPLLEMKAKLEGVSGDIEKSERLCDEALLLQQEYGYTANSLRFLKEIIPLFEGKDWEAFDKYNLQALEMHLFIRDISNDLTTDYIFSIYGNKYAKYQDKANKTMTIMVASIVVMFILTLIILLLQSRKQSIMDSLTNVYNRRYFEKVYNRYMISQEKFAVIMIDVDYFKNVNDTYGHDFGDIVLAQLCESFYENKFKNSKLFRIGGEEFCILYKCEKLEKAIGLAEKLRLSTEEVDWGEGRSVTISVGLAFSGQSNDLYNLADKNLYFSKKSGRNRVTYTH